MAASRRERKVGGGGGGCKEAEGGLLLFSSYSVVGGRLVHRKLALVVVLRYRGKRGEGGEEGSDISWERGRRKRRRRPLPPPSISRGCQEASSLSPLFPPPPEREKGRDCAQGEEEKKGTFRVPRRLGKRRSKKLVDPQVLLFHHSDCDARKSFFPVCCCVWEYKTSANDAFRDIRGINRTLRKGIRPEVTSSPQ